MQKLLLNFSKNILAVKTNTYTFHLSSQPWISIILIKTKKEEIEQQSHLLAYVEVPNMLQNAPVLLAVCCPGLGDKLIFVMIVRKW